MDGSALALRKKLDELLLQAAEISVALDQAEGTLVGIPHYSAIEARAHAIGQQLSREIQQRQMAQLTASTADFAKCPKCGTRCRLDREHRQVNSIDGTLRMEEPVGYCPKCRRGFFPPPGKAWL
jgi:hypothetical protein